MSDAPGSESGHELDPFTGHERFASTLRANRPTARARPEELEPLEPLDVTIDKLVDLEALERRATFEGMVRSPRTLEEDELDTETSDAMTECKPQFQLRNLNRAERFVDPEQPMDFEANAHPIGLPEEDPDAPDPMAPVRPELLASLSSDAVRGFRRDHRRLFQETAWNDHFSREIKEDAEGPLWRSREPVETDEDGPS